MRDLFMLANLFAVYDLRPCQPTVLPCGPRIQLTVTDTRVLFGTE